MKTLPKTFTRSVEGAQGYKVTLEQLERAGHIAVYQRTAPQWTDYEAIRIRESKGGEMKTTNAKGEEVKVEFEAKERYPSTKEWGTDGFTFQTEAGARAKMAELLKLPSTGTKS